MPGATAAPPVPDTLTRDGIVRLGQSGRPWAFVPVAIRALAANPHDDAVRFLLAAAYARLHLRDPAAEELARLSELGQKEPNVAALRGLLPQIPDTRIDPDQRRRTCRRNLDALTARGLTLVPDLEARFQSWSAAQARLDCFQTADGNLVRRAGGAWTRFADDRSEAQRLELPEVPPGGRGSPWVIEGMDPPWWFQRVAAAAPRSPDGYWPRITVVQGSFDEFLDGLAAADLSAELGLPRVQVIVGDRAAERLAADLDHRSGTLIDGPSLVIPGIRTPAAPGIDEVVAAAARRQAQEEVHLLEAVDEVYAGRDRAWWARRFDEALSGGGGGWGGGGGEPLRVLIPTCRYSTFVQHSAADLARAMEARGLRARLLIEPDDSSLLSTVGYLKAMLDFQPDLVVLINYTRANVGKAVHPNVPCVCWVQDAMPHLFDAAIGARQGELDFLAGHAHEALFETFGYPRDRAVTFPVVASHAKFHPGPVAPELRQRLECEIALVSHHSETPQRLHQRLCAEAGGTPAVVRIMERLYPAVRDLAEAAASRPVLPGLRAAAAEAARAVLGRTPDERTLALLYNQYAMPMADRVIRHQTVRWAAAVSRRRSWRLRLFGRGWETHPEFAEFAGGELAHGEDLRASYQCAAVHLHASVNWSYHQRVMECALSGGLPLCRRKEDDLSLLWAYTLRALAERCSPFASKLDGRRTQVYAVADSPDTLRLMSTLHRLSHPHGNSPSVHLWPDRLAESRRAWQGMPMDPDAAWLLGDWTENTFADEADLERAVERAATRPAWRADVSAGIAARVRKFFTYEAVADKLLEMVGGLGGRAEDRGPGNTA